MIFEKNELLRIIDMLSSTDEASNNLAFEIIDQSVDKRDITQLIVIYRLSNLTLESWEKKCKKAYERISAFGIFWNGPLLTKLLEEGCEESALEILMKELNKFHINIFKDMGYPVNKLDINVKIKE
jgi:hypothetical protein